MKAARILALVALVAGCDAASAFPVRPDIGPDPRAVLAPIQMVCGPNRCFARPYWRYGDGFGFRPFRRAGPFPARRFAYPPFGFGRFAGPGGFRRR